MREIDQALRADLPDETPSNTELERLATVDRANTRRLAEIIRACGWPDQRRFGAQASDDAWLLAQHADQDRLFQRRAMALLSAAVERGDAPAKHLAYLYDRLATADGKPQHYGTQLRQTDRCKLELLPIDSRLAVNERLKAAGMPSLEEYEQRAREALLPKDCENPRNDAAAP